MLEKVAGPGHRLQIMKYIKQGLTHCSLLYLKLNRLQKHLHFKTGIYSKYSDKLGNTCFLAFANNICAFSLEGGPGLSYHQVNEACVSRGRGEKPVGAVGVEGKTERCEMRNKHREDGFVTSQSSRLSTLSRPHFR